MARDRNPGFDFALPVLCADGQVKALLFEVKNWATVTEPNKPIHTVIDELGRHNVLPIVVNLSRGATRDFKCRLNDQQILVAENILAPKEIQLIKAQPHHVTSIMYRIPFASNYAILLKPPADYMSLVPKPELQSIKAMGSTDPGVFLYMNVGLTTGLSAITPQQLLVPDEPKTSTDEFNLTIALMTD